MLGFTSTIRSIYSDNREGEAQSKYSNDSIRFGTYDVFWGCLCCILVMNPIKESFCKHCNMGHR